MGETIHIAARDGSGQFSAYSTQPATGPAPVIVVIQEIFGVNAGIRAMCDTWTQHGFAAIAPDLFWRQKPNVQLTDQTEAEWQEAFGYYNGFDFDKGVEDIEATIKHARTLAHGNGMVGVVGYCLGGHMAFLSATRTDTDASVSYYGGGIDQRLQESHAISRPLMLHLAVEDKFIPADAQKAIHAALDDHPRVTIHDYPGVDHAFARVNGIHRDEAAANLADKRTLEFFREHLVKM